MDLVSKARDFARAKHDGQFRGGTAREPYAVHLAEVAALVASFGGSAEVQAAAWLHDTVEDCGVLPEEIAALFGPEVAGIVAEVTDDKTLEKSARKRAQVAHAAGKSPGGALVKICDKISNIRAVGASPHQDWDAARQMAYLDWAEEVVSRLPAAADVARPLFAAERAQAEAAVAARG